MDPKNTTGRDKAHTIVEIPRKFRNILSNRLYETEISGVHFRS